LANHPIDILVTPKKQGRFCISGQIPNKTVFSIYFVDVGKKV